MRNLGLKKYFFAYHFPDDYQKLFERIAFFVNEHNSIKPHAVHKHKLTPDQAFLGIEVETKQIQQRTEHALAARKKENRKAICPKCF